MPQNRLSELTNPSAQHAVSRTDPAILPDASSVFGHPPPPHLLPPPPPPPPPTLPPGSLLFFGPPPPPPSRSRSTPPRHSHPPPPSFVPLLALCPNAIYRVYRKTRYIAF